MRFGLEQPSGAPFVASAMQLKSFPVPNDTRILAVYHYRQLELRHTLHSDL
jgi:hypothetical protein